MNHNIISFRCCNEECGKHYPDSEKGKEHWQHAKLSFIQYLKHWINGHDVYFK